MSKRCAASHWAQAASEKQFDLALSKLDAIEKGVTDWRKHLQDSKAAEAAPVEPEKEPEPPAESIEFEVNVTHTPKKCARKSVEGSVMKVHYVGKIIKTKKIFASSFHTGARPPSTCCIHLLAHSLLLRLLGGLTMTCAAALFRLDAAPVHVGWG